MGQIAGIVPGGLKEHRWDGDTLYFVIEAMGQRVASRIEVHDANIHAVVDLPPLAALFAGAIKEQLGQVGNRLLR
ncbi:polyhydroxyalkanoic acid system family protein [Novosphingobium sp. G106]|uniref:polyhydroxyalkanoic acid system family protein n=1 Tax=Novosphingobium sp. G106 TaxID=2849500 RepID=UPI0020C3D89B|nr:polyhydroxyalkanoic acid system family protein [Novosphingobium sp. G106]